MSMSSSLSSIPPERAAAISTACSTPFAVTSSVPAVSPSTWSLRFPKRRGRESRRTTTTRTTRSKQQKKQINHYDKFSISCSVSTRKRHEHDYHDGSHLRHHVVLYDQAQQKKQKEIQKFQNELTEGQQVITGGGIYGTVKSIDLTKNTVDIKIARDVVITVDKSYVFKDTANVPMQK